MATIRVTCPTCKSDLEIDSVHEGEEVECGNCLQVFRAERPGSRSAPGPAKRPADRRRSDDDDDDDDRPRRRRRYEYDDDDDYYPPPSRRRRRGSAGDGLAVWALVLGCVGLVMACCCWPVSFPLGLAATITGGLGMKSQNDKGMAVTGLVLGIFTLGLGGVMMVFGLANGLGQGR